MCYHRNQENKKNEDQQRIHDKYALIKRVQTRRPGKYTTHIKTVKIKFTCSLCKNLLVGGRMFLDELPYCKACYNKKIDYKNAQKILQISNAQKLIDIIDPINEMRKTCTKMGTCDILHIHHELLKDDPERLTTEFMIQNICGKDKLERYKSKKALKNKCCLLKKRIA